MSLQHAITSFLAWGLLAASPSHGAEDSVLKKVTFCHALDEQQRPKDTAESFANTETVYLSVELNGRPKSGVVSTKFMFRDTLMAETEVEVAPENPGETPSTSEPIFAGFKLDHQDPLPVGDCYTAEISFDGKPLGTFPFRIAPPKDALPSKVKSVTLAKGIDEQFKPLNETREFEGEDKVMLVGTADLGLSSWLEVTWTVDGKVDEAGTRTLTFQENKADAPFSFSFMPEDGWPTGNHEVALQLNGREVAHEKFTVKKGVPKFEVASVRLFRGDGKGHEGQVVESFAPSDIVLGAEWRLKQPAPIKRIQIVWMVEAAAGARERKIATSDLEGGVNKFVTSTLTTKKGLPLGRYRVELFKGGKRIDAKTFEVK